MNSTSLPGGSIFISGDFPRLMKLTSPSTSETRYFVPFKTYFRNNRTNASKMTAAQVHQILLLPHRHLFSTWQPEGAFVSLFQHVFKFVYHFIFAFFFFAATFTKHKISHLKMNNPVLFSAFTILCNCNFYLVPECFYYPKRKACTQ